MSDQRITRNDVFDYACFDIVQIEDDGTVLVQLCDHDTLEASGTLGFVKVGVLAEGFSVEDARNEVMEAYGK